MEQLITISTVGFIISAVAAAAGVALSAITFLKFNIREIFMIRSGRGLKNALLGMEKQRAETGTLRNAPLEASEEKDSKKKKKAKKSGNGGMKASETVPLKAAGETMPLKAAPETMPLNRSSETMPLSHAPETAMLNQGFETMPLDAETAGMAEPAYDFESTGEKADLVIISEEMETHTEEEI